MGRHKQDNSRTKALTFKFTQKEYDLIQLLSAQDKTELINRVRILVNAYTANKVSKYNSSKLENNTNITETNNSSKLENNNSNIIDNSSKLENNNSNIIDNSSKLENNNVVQNNNVRQNKPEISDEEINDLIEDVQLPVHKAIKRRVPRPKQLSEYEQTKAIRDAIEAAKYNGVNSLFGGGCE